MWERSLRLTSCPLVVVQRILFDPSRLVYCWRDRAFSLHGSSRCIQVIWKCGSFSLAIQRISHACLDTDIRALSTTQSHDSTNTESDKYSSFFDFFMFFFLFFLLFFSSFVLPFFLSSSLPFFFSSFLPFFLSSSLPLFLFSSFFLFFFLFFSVFFFSFVSSSFFPFFPFFFKKKTCQTSERHASIRFNIILCRRLGSRNDLLSVMVAERAQ